MVEARCESRGSEDHSGVAGRKRAEVRTAPSKLGRISAVTGNAYQLLQTTARMLK
ncbi:MAG: hypothetical protein IKU83_00390 [Lachnospiraceae bacterium]|nr:hypothetical protein [Lachnospiraceae bacterium]